MQTFDTSSVGAVVFKVAFLQGSLASGQSGWSGPRQSSVKKKERTNHKEEKEQQEAQKRHREAKQKGKRRALKIQRPV